MPGRLRAKSKPLAVLEPARPESKLEKLRLVVPEGQGKKAEILGSGADAAARIVEVMQRWAWHERPAGAPDAR